MIPVVRLDPTSHWDQNTLAELFAGHLAPHHLDLREEAGLWPDADGIILVIPGREWSDRDIPLGGELTATQQDRYRQLSDAIARYGWVLAIRTSDEEDWFDPARIVHPNIRWWIQFGRPDHDYAGARTFGANYPPHFNQLPTEPPDPYFDVFLAARDTHDRRHECFAAVEHLGDNVITHTHASKGFAQGHTPLVYTAGMIGTKIAPAPAGPATPDSHRFYEALQAHCIPLADDICPGYDSTGYWRMCFPEAPFPIITDWSGLPELVAELLAAWPGNANRIAGWWICEKRRLARWLRDDLAALGAPLEGADAGPAITAVVPISPIPSHPDTHIIDETIASIRYWLPDTQIVLTFDGVRAEQEDMRPAYEEHIRRVLWRADHAWGNTIPLIFDDHRHQSGMLGPTLDHVDTPLLLYVEHDAPLVCDEPIDWELLAGFVLNGDANLIRLHHEALILPAHQHLMHGVVGELTRTSQWSQRPHLTSTAFYCRVLEQFSPQAKCFIDDRMASAVQCAVDEYGTLGWEQWRLWVYTPTKDTNIKRSYHLDGRAGAPKYHINQGF
jgi:hypothetical protein